MLQLPETDWNTKQRQVVQDYYRQTVNTQLDRPQQALTQAENERAAYFDELPKCLVSISDPQKRTVRILPRGNWMDESGEVVKPALPAFYLPTPAVEGRELTRLDLAEWLVSRENPLTARTVMNRMWKQFFGIGLSRVLDDLGAQGEPPVNPALLDWLACEFMDSGWDVQHMVRVIVTSDTYQQVSTSSKELTAADPDNRECARQSPFRLEAELVRDNALEHLGPAGAEDRRPQCEALSAGTLLGESEFPDAGVAERQWRKPVSPWPVYVVAAHRFCTPACWPLMLRVARNARRNGTGRISRNRHWSC